MAKHAGGGARVNPRPAWSPRRGPPTGALSTGAVAAPAPLRRRPRPTTSPKPASPSRHELRDRSVLIVDGGLWAHPVGAGSPPGECREGLLASTVSRWPSPRWVTETSDGHTQWYIERFRALAAEGADLAGEARLVDAMLPRAARVLDAGCGTGRVGRAACPGPHGRGCRRRPGARRRRPCRPPRPLLARRRPGRARPRGDGRAPAVRRRDHVGQRDGVRRPRHRVRRPGAVAAHVAADGFVIVGVSRPPQSGAGRLDRCAADAGLEIEHRFSTWTCAGGTTVRISPSPFSATPDTATDAT